MQIGKFRELRSLRQPSIMSTKRTRDINSTGPMEGQRLVFLYPLLYDQKYQTLINEFRDFFTVCYIGEVKISNVLSITSDSYNVGSIGHGNKVINPAQLVRQSIWSTPEQHSNPYDTYINQSLYGYNKAEYQERINQFNSFIKNQLEHDPRYIKLRPIISSITVENLINVPLIMGTQSYGIDSIYLYFLLLMAVTYNIPLDTSSNIQRLFNTLDVVDKQNLPQILFDSESKNKFNRMINYDPNSNVTGNSMKKRIQQQYKPTLKKGLFTDVLLNNTSIRKLGGWMNTERSKAQVFFDLALDIDRWTALNNNIESRSSININALTIPSSIQSRHYQRAMTSFGHYVENCIVPIFHGLDLIAGPTYAGVSISEKIEEFLNVVIDNLSEEYMVISTMIINEIKNEYAVNHDAEINNSIKNIIDLCGENIDIGSAVKKQLEFLDTALRIPSSFDGKDLNDFYSAITKTSSQFDVRQKVLDSWLKSLTKTTAGSQLTTNISNILSKFARIVHSVLWEQFPTNSQYGHPWITVLRDSGQFYYRYTNFCTSIIGIDPANINLALVNDRHIHEFFRMIHEIEQSIVKMLSFFFKWNFFSYTCSYMNDVDVDIEIQRRDALEFPNYCLVLPYRLFQGLYITTVVHNFDRIMNQKITDDTLASIDERDVMPNIDDTNRLINMVNSRLKIPNLILIDEKTNTCYYKFMYMTKPIKTSLSAMKQFINHQKDMLPGF